MARHGIQRGERKRVKVRLVPRRHLCASFGSMGHVLKTQYLDWGFDMDFSPGLLNTLLHGCCESRLSRWYTAVAETNTCVMIRARLQQDALYKKNYQWPTRRSLFRDGTDASVKTCNRKQRRLADRLLKTTLFCSTSTSCCRERVHAPSMVSGLTWRRPHSTKVLLGWARRGP